MEQLIVRKLISEYLASSQTRNPSFSLRAFARKLEISHSALSEILRGKRRVSEKLACRLMLKMGTSENEVGSVIKLFRLKRGLPETDLDPKESVRQYISEYQEQLDSMLKADALETS